MSSGSGAPRTMDVNEIMEVLPHRYPFLLVDRVLELRPGSVAVGLKAITINEDYFQGHFPGHPVTPAVLITEMMAQVGGILLLTVSGNEGKLAYFTGIDKQKFRKPVGPGDLLVTRVELLAARGHMGKIRATSYVFRLESSTIDHPAESISELPKNSVACVADSGGSRERKLLLGAMEGELAAEGELMFALMERNRSASSVEGEALAGETD